MPKIAAALARGSFLALASGRSLVNLPWERQLAELLPRYSTNQEYRPYDLEAELAERGLFQEEGRCVTELVPYRQSIEDYVEWFHTRNGFSRRRMTARSAAEFDGVLREQRCIIFPDGVFSGETRASFVWRMPLG